ncbi:2Fe-2S iron-sulfur cluster-binding protein, partial [Zavarzinia sp.]|uniref:2Fe-2S iron-sulfur cluster-binding protein n=1 Tax=Zavarzinia sp. TaxID=2027920 RepID=UPI003565130A
MPRITIDNRSIEVPAGTTILAAARAAGIDIPTLCFLEDLPPQTSCMVCVVKVDGGARLVPSCAMPVRDGMHVESETDEVRAARRTALELLLSDHLGDCIAPCQAACPAHLNVPLVIRQVADGAISDATQTIRDRIALPGVLGRICPAPCEKACRRAGKDHAVSICLLHRYAADAAAALPRPVVPPCRPATGKSVGIVGAEAAGLAAAFYLLRDGHECTLFDEHDRPGGLLRQAVPESRLPRNVLDDNIAVIRRMGAAFCPRTRVDSPAELQDRFDAIIVATGTASKAQGEQPGRNVFLAGGPAGSAKMAVRALAAGRTAALAASRFLAGLPAAPQEHEFSTHIGHMEPAELSVFATGASETDRVSPADTLCGFTKEEARAEA